MAWFRRGATIDVDALAGEVALKIAASVPGLGMLPAGASSSDLTAQARAAATVDLAGSMFGPGMPLQPMGIDPRDPATGVVDPRRSEFPVSWNLQLPGQRHVPFATLRDAADRVDIVRRCIEVRKAHMLALDWDITISRTALKRIMADDGITSPGRAAQAARVKFEPEIARLREWWQKPDRFNGLGFPAWLGMLLEELFVIDAATVWPRANRARTIAAFEILDGATIKPLLDHRGATPYPPQAAFQQVLHGFPRGDYLAGAAADCEFVAGELVYRPRNRRTWTPYGFSEVEQALSSIDLYLKSIGWIRSEFDDGTTPSTWMKTDIKAGMGKGEMSADQFRQWETVMNQLLAGNPAERNAIHLLPAGFNPTEMRTFAERFNPDMYEMIIKLVCMCFSVMPTEVGFPPKSGLGGKGHQEGEENSAYRKDIRPTAVWLAELLTDLSREYLGAPPELEFTFIGYETEDQLDAEQASDLRLKGGRATLNDERAKAGRPLYDFPEADMPYVQTSAGLVFLDGALAAQQAAMAPGDTAVPGAPMNPNAPADVELDESAAPPADGDGFETLEVDTTGDGVPDGFIRVRSYVRAKRPMAEIEAEVAKFASFARKRAGRAWRDFEFETAPAELAERLNTLGAAGDLEAIKAVVADVGKAAPRRLSVGAKRKMIDRHAALISTAARALVDPDALIAAWAEDDTADKAAAPRSSRVEAARVLVGDNLGDTGDLDDAIGALLDDGYSAARAAAGDDGGETGARHKALTKTRAAITATAVATIVAVVADALCARDSDASTIDAVFEPDVWAEDLASVELTEAVTAGALDGAEARGINLVRIVVAGGECEFCQEYDGRIMPLDHDAGMPPLHTGCQCDIEPVEDD